MLQTKKPKMGQQKPKLKKTRTFTSSQQTLCEDHRNNSLLDFSKPEQRKKKLEIEKKSESQKQQLARAKKAHRGKSRGKAQQNAAYQFVNCKSSINSEIVFSNQETARHQEKQNRITIRVKPAYLVQSRQLGATIKREYQRKVQAAVKIQKVFRGYLTRKVLERCMQREQERLHTHLLSLRSEILGKVQSCNNYYHKRRQQEADNSSSSEDEQIVYRHHEPIFSQDEIGDYLSSSEDEDFDQKAFDNQIIFETNEQYFDSHKSSLNHPLPKNKLSASHFHQQEASNKGITPKENSSLQRKMELYLCEEMEKDSTLKIHKRSMEDFQKTLPNHMEPSQLGETIKEHYHNLKEGALIGDDWGLQQLKNEQTKKWYEMISILKAHTPNEASTEQLISSLISLSQHNMSLIAQTHTKLKSKTACQFPSLNHEKSKEKVLMLKETRKELQKAASRNQEDQPISSSGEKKRRDTGINCISKLSFSQSPTQLKNFFKSLQTHKCQPLLKLREQVIKANEMEERSKLSEAIEAKKISQEMFLLRLDEINRSYNKQKVQIAQEKEVIMKGYQAIIEQAKGVLVEAHLLGTPLPISRSDEGIKHKSSITDLVGRHEFFQAAGPAKEKKKREIQAELIRIESSEEQSSDLSFSQEQLQRFQKAKLFNLQFEREIADLGSNVTISQQLSREKIGDKLILGEPEKKQAGREIFLIEEFSIPQIPVEQEQVADGLLTQLIWQAAGQLFMSSIFTKKLIDKSLLCLPGKVTNLQRLSFIKHLQAHFPPIETLNSKLNQKISPLPRQMLRCMRIDFSEESQADSYEEIGKYEFIIGQEVCNQAVRSFRASLEPTLMVVEPALKKVELLCEAYQFTDRLKRYLLQREKYVCDRLSQTQELRWEVINIQIHCIFDAWNEEIIAFRSERAGYSGIGLNQLTLSVMDQNSKVREERTLHVIDVGKKRLIESLSQGSAEIVFPQAAKKCEDELERDSKWIFYADQALSYSLELVYLIEEDIFSEVGRDLLELRLLS